MLYSNTTDKNGIIQITEDYTDLGYGYISGTTDNLKKFTTYANEVYGDIWYAIWSATGAWQWDDKNQTDLPQSTTNLVNGTFKYSLPTQAATIKRIELKDVNGNWIKLKPLIKEKDYLTIDKMESVSGNPTHYYMTGDTIQVYPTPNYDSTSGMKVYFDRELVEFSYNDTTKEPGFLGTFHGLIPLGMAIKWLKIKQPQSHSLAQFQLDFKDQMAQLTDFYAKRWDDGSPAKLTGQTQSME